MNSNVTEEDLLLYWSNELAADRVQAVEESRQRDPEAAKYLAELDVLQDAIEDVPKKGPCEPIAHNDISYYQRCSKITVSPKTLRLASMAAGLAFLASVGLLALRPLSNPQTPTAAAPPLERITDTEPSAEITQVTDESLLSERLFASRSPSSSDPRVKAAWERVEKIRGLLANSRIER